ncbi:MAG: ERCC4 domain-containing protein [Clostridia bacterium]
MIVIDTRQQAQKHAEKDAYFKMHNIPTIRSKCIVGDYTRLDNQTVSVDTKKDILEIAGNICGKQHERFKAECERARACGVKLIFLIEEVPPNGDLACWVSPKNKNGKLLSNVKGETLKKCMATMTLKYGVEFEFVSREETPQKILKILEVDYDG